MSKYRMSDELYEVLNRHKDWPVLNHEDRTRFLTLALCGEVGEMAETIGDQMTDDLRKELADIGNYLFILHIHLGISPRVYRDKSDMARLGKPVYLALDVFEYAGKLANLVKKSWRGDFKLEDRGASLNEYLYGLNYALFDLAMHFDLDLQQEMLNKMREVEQRDVYKNRNQANGSAT